jgi:4-alpha-glucanotransferase
LTSTSPSLFSRSAGVLLHPTSLPGPYGLGDLGPAVHAWIDALASAGQSWWQVLPLGPTGFGDSPYQCFSAFAGNPYLVSPELLVRDGLLQQSDLAEMQFPEGPIDYGPVIGRKQQMLLRAWQNFHAGSAAHLTGSFEAFAAENVDWLEDYALFMALKDFHSGKGWQDWPMELRRREPAALEAARRNCREAVRRQEFAQFLFFRQWGEVRQHARERGLRIIGDLPIFVSADSADVWSNPDLFMLDEHRRPTHVAGVPPDYFSTTGQLWGNPLYNWEALKQSGYRWWIGRLATVLKMVDVVRLDHFRGFEAYWEVPAGMPTAEIGRWVKGPGEELFLALRQALGGLPWIAEDLGVITKAVSDLREGLRLPGMRVLQFAFGGQPENLFLPHNYEPNTVVYTGTHDNDTTHGWFATLPPHERAFLSRYAPWVGREAAWELLRLAWSSVADLALTPLQDVLGLGTEARMNLPGRPAGNWCWRLLPDQLTRGHLERLADLTTLYSRNPGRSQSR